MFKKYSITKLIFCNWKTKYEKEKNENLESIGKVQIELSETTKI